MSERPRSTVVVLGSYAPSLINFRGSLISALAERGYRILALAPAIGDEVASKLRGLGAEPLDVPIVNNSLNPIQSFASLCRLANVFREIAPEAVISYTVKPVTLGSLAAALAGVPNIVALVTGLGFAFTEGGGLKRLVSRAVASTLYRLAFRRCTSIIFQNPDDRDHFRSLGLLPEQARVTVVNGSGIDLGSFQPAPLTDEPRFLMIARLLGDKGVREYGEAAIRVKKRFPEASFQLAGYFDQSPDAIQPSELDRMIAGGVEYIGKLDDVRPAIAGSNIYVLPSYREGTPRSVLEAMAMGRPIITTDTPGCRETVEQGCNGFLVAPRQVESLTAAMQRFIGEPALISAMGEQSRALAERKFEAGSVSSAIIEAAGL